MGPGDLEVPFNPSMSRGHDLEEAPLLEDSAVEDSAETDPCLGHDDEIAFASRTGGLSVYVTLHRIRRLILASIDDPYTFEELRAPRMNTFVLRPLVDRLYSPDDLLVVYCLLANRVQFLRSHSSETLHQTVNIARANLCELVATRVLRRFHEDSPGRQGLLLLANILVSGFDPFHGAPDAVQREGRQQQWPVQERGGHERKLTALELAILSESKTFIGSLACQRVVSAVYHGIVTYTPLSFVDILPDHYKHHPVSLYEPSKAPILNHYRLIVPRSRNLIELFHFVILLLLFILTMIHRNAGSLSAYESAFVIFAAGWVLEQFAAIIEHGWEVHAQNLWSFLDVTFIAIYAAYIVARAVEILVGSSGTAGNRYALHILCTAAPVLLTRIAFNLMPDNIVFISLHAMIKDFMRLTFLAAWCFIGFLVALQWLVDGANAGTTDNAPPSWATVCKWLLWIWFGLDGTGIDRSVEFHAVLGPALMIAFAFLGNTLFLTILVAMLTNTFSKTIADEAAEIQFRRAVLTFQGVKSDSIFAYPPPLNILALVTLLPLKFLVSPRMFHSVNVALIRVVNAPTLLLISLYERRRLLAQHKTAATIWGGLLNWRFTGFSPHGDIQAVFKAEPPPEVQELLEELESLSDVESIWNQPDWLVPRPSRNNSRSLSVSRRRRRRPSGRDVFKLSNAPQR